MRRSRHLILIALCGMLYVSFTLLCLCAGIAVVVQVPFTLAIGWVNYLQRVLPQLHPDPASVISAMLCLLGVTLGGHAFLRWLYTSTSPDGQPRRWPWKWTIQLVALVVLLFVAGIAATGVAHQTGWLMRSPELLIRDNRDASDRSISMNRLKGIYVGAISFNDEPTVNQLPRSTFDASGRPFHSWQTQLLLYVDQANVYHRIDLTKPWTHPDNVAPLATPVSSFLHPASDVQFVNGFAASHYAGNVHVVLSDTPKQFADFPQGTSSTIFAGEVNAEFRAWGDPLNARDPRHGANGLPGGFGGFNGNPAQFAMLDGSVRSFNPKELADLAAGKVPE